MNIWIDCEFNDFYGELISLGMVDEDGREFYEVLHCEKPTPWVAANVMPILGRPACSRRLMQARLEQWLSAYGSVHLIADWPEDITHFCQSLITGPGMRMDTPPLTMEIRRDLDSALSAIPHHALEDAKAIRAAHLAKK